MSIPKKEEVGNNQICKSFGLKLQVFSKFFSSLCAFYAICIGMNNHENADDDASEAEEGAVPAEVVGLWLKQKKN